MATLTVTANGKVTLGKDVLHHLGIRSGGNIRIELLPGGRAELSLDQPGCSWDELGGILKGKGNGARLTIEELNEAIAEAGASAGEGKL